MSRNASRLPARLGFVGLGNLGRHLAASLLRAGYPLTVHDRDEAAAGRCSRRARRGRRRRASVAARSPTASSRACRRRARSTTSSPATAGCSRGCARAARGSTRARTTRASCDAWRRSPSVGRRTVSRRRSRAASISRPRARSRCSSAVTRSVYAAHLPAFEAIGGKIFHIGPLGSASVIKVITNMLAFIHLVAVGEALMLARRAGLDLGAGVRGDPGQLGQQLRPRDREPGDPERQLRHRLHDGPRAARTSASPAGSGTSSACRSSSPTSSSRRSSARASAYGGSAWSPMVVKLLEDALGTDLRAPGFPPVIEA